MPIYIYKLSALETRVLIRGVVGWPGRPSNLPEQRGPSTGRIWKALIPWTCGNHPRRKPTFWFYGADYDMDKSRSLVSVTALQSGARNRYRRSSPARPCTPRVLIENAPRQSVCLHPGPTQSPRSRVSDILDHVSKVRKVGRNLRFCAVVRLCRSRPGIEVVTTWRSPLKTPRKYRLGGCRKEMIRRAVVCPIPRSAIRVEAVGTCRTAKNSLAGQGLTLRGERYDR